MKRKHLAYAVVFLVLAVLVYLQFRTWKNFDWSRFLETRPTLVLTSFTASPNLSLRICCGLFRWKIFLKPVRAKLGLEHGYAHDNRIHRTRAIRAPWRINSALFDRTPPQFDLFISDGSVGGRAHIRLRRLHRSACDGHLLVEWPAGTEGVYGSFKKLVWLSRSPSAAMVLGVLAVHRRAKELQTGQSAGFLTWLQTWDRRSRWDPRVPQRFRYNPWPDFIDRSLGPLARHVVHDRYGLPGCGPFLRRGSARYSAF